MKRFTTAMIFSLAVIVCEQQTLFAPHYNDWSGLTVANPGDTTNSLVPVAGSDSLIAIIAIQVANGSNPAIVGDNAGSGEDDLTSGYVDTEFGLIWDAPFGVRGGSVCPTAGADKVTSYSSNDPAFFSHHANIDYIWD